MPEPRHQTDVWEGYSYLPNRRCIVYATGTYRQACQAAYDACLRVYEGMRDRNALGVVLRNEEAVDTLTELYRRIQIKPEVWWGTAYGTTFGVRRKVIDDG